ncbi:hypothetical protein FA13DRAFT_1797833 [Coprinellus micaceus]|uniref:F-box domain-containing protein n=1 Tax=Coprinellus micaceus TaxID=71717 RepID=A0A4Y7SP16_COPMI|nr:hypothetical protein FA13DRAFT_1797833 [Coprinellus micaceus]
MEAGTNVLLPLDLVQRISDIPNFRCWLFNHIYFKGPTSWAQFRSDSERATEGLVQKRLKILTTSPHLGSYVKHLTVTMKDGRNDPDIPALLNHFTGLRSLSLASISFRGQALWDWFTPAFRKSIGRLCRLSTLETLNLNKLRGVPASLFLTNQSLASISLAGSCPLFDVSSPDVASISESSLPLTLNVSDVDLAELDLEDIVTQANAFFHRVHTLKGSTTWEGESSVAFSAFLSLLAGISPLEHLSVTLSTEYATRSPTVPPPNLLGSLTQIRGLKVLTLTGRDAARSYPLRYFVSALPRVVSSLDTTSLERLSLNIIGVKYQDLSTLCGSQSLGSKSSDSLDAILASRHERGTLAALREVRLTIQIDRTEFNMKLEEANRAVREAGFLSSLPVEMVRVVLKSKVGNVMYDSRQFVVG